MRIKEGFVLRSVAGTNVVVPVGENAMEGVGMLSLNETGVLLWKALEKDVSKEDLTELVLAEYDVERATASADVEEFLEEVKKYQALQL